MARYQCRCGEQQFTELETVLLCDSCGFCYRKPDDYQPVWDEENS